MINITKKIRYAREQVEPSIWRLTSFKVFYEIHNRTTSDIYEQALQQTRSQIDQVIMEQLQYIEKIMTQLRWE